MPLIIGNKSDLKEGDAPVLSEADALQFSEEVGIPYRSVSAKTGEGVEEVF